MSLRSALDTFRGHRVPRIDLVGRRRLFFAVSGLLFVASIGSLAFRQLNFSIAFNGGALLEYPNADGVSVDEVREVTADFGREDAEIQIVDGTDISIRTGTLNDLGPGRRAELLEALAEQAGVEVDDINIQDVGPRWGAQISRQAIIGLAIFMVLVTLYITMRFELKMALAAIVALVHDLVITIGVYSLAGLEVTPETVIATLTILGWSLYDTVVIFDRIKENTSSQALLSREGYSGVVNLSLNETFMRSINTSLVVILPVGALLFFGGETLRSFAFALTIGIIVGAYSSIAIAAPLLALLKEREPRYRSIRERVLTRAAAPGRATASGSPSAASKTPSADSLPVGEGDELETAAASTSAARPARKPPTGARGSGGSSKASQRAKRRRR